jgi:hypothetical protein
MHCTSLNIRINRIKDVISLSSPVIASTPGSIRLRKESKSFKMLDTYTTKKLREKINNDCM